MSLRFAILGLLAQSDLSGYEITKRFEQSVGYFWHARSQQIYPELARLEEDGFIAGRVVAQVGRPDKREFSLTNVGKAELKQWVLTPSPMTFGKDEFLVKVWSYGQIDSGDAASALEAQRLKHEERLGAYRAIRDAIPGSERRPLHPDLLGPLLTLDAGIAMEVAFIQWCREAESVLRGEAGTP